MGIRTKKGKALIIVSIVIIVIAFVIVFYRCVLFPIMFPIDPRFNEIAEICDYINNEYKDSVEITHIYFKDKNSTYSGENEFSCDFKILEDQSGDKMTEDKANIGYEIRTYIQNYLETNQDHILVTDTYKIDLHFFSSYKLGGFTFRNYHNNEKLGGITLVLLTDIIDIVPINYLSSFQEIEYIVSGVAFDKKDLEVLSNLPNLKKVQYYWRNIISEEQLEKVKAVVPEGCEVISDNH